LITAVLCGLFYKSWERQAAAAFYQDWEGQRLNVTSGLQDWSVLLVRTRSVDVTVGAAARLEAQALEKKGYEVAFMERREELEGWPVFFGPSLCFSASLGSLLRPPCRTSNQFFYEPVRKKIQKQLLKQAAVLSPRRQYKKSYGITGSPVMKRPRKRNLL
jgi:hypothetical protein